MNKLKVSTRLILTTGLLALLLLAVGAVGLAGMHAGNQSLKTVYDDRVVPLGQLAEIQREQEMLQHAIDDALFDGGEAALDQAVAQAERHGRRIDEVWQAYLATYLTTEEKQLAQQSTEARQRQRSEGLAPVLAAMRAHDASRAEALMRSTLDQATAEVSIGVEKLVALQIDVAAQEHTEAVARYDTMLQVMVCAVVSGLALATLLAWTLVRSLMRQLGAEPAEAAALVHAVAQGDLTVPIHLREGDQTSLMASLQQMQGSLQRVVAVVRRDADGVATASSEIAQGTLDLSQRTEEQASALQQTAASMEQLTATVRQNAEHAQAARQFADGAADVAQRGGQAVQDVVQTMKGIEDSSRRISDIIGVIDGIAFQTNILALNAAVEAARAGEHGRGFAVVAGEVRSLAQRCAESAKEVKVLIGESVGRVDSGTRLVGQAGDRMSEIMVAIGRVKDLVGEISSASEEQSAGVAQIGQAVAQMDQVTQQNAALVEESSAAAESLRGQSAHLLEATSVFQLGDVAAAPAPAPGWCGADRRGPQRAANGLPPAFSTTKGRALEASVAGRPRAAVASTGTDDWTSF
jgi:methyl-accepting chemotaxis protein